MSTLKANEAQLGQSAESADNYVFSNTAGVLNLASGSAGDIQDNLISVQTSGEVDIAANTTIAGSFVVPTVSVSKDSTDVANVQYVDNALTTYCDYYNLLPKWQSVATNGAFQGDLIFDSAGNLYWAVPNYYNGTTYTQTSYVYKITPSGSFSTYASVSTTGAGVSKLAIDSAGNLYWGISNRFNGSIYSFTSYLYKITPAQAGTSSPTVFASAATLSCLGMDIVLDVDGTVYWAVMNEYDGTSFIQTSYVYKITSTGTKTVFASLLTNNAISCRLKYNSSTNYFYWAFAEAAQYSIYRINGAGNMSLFASMASTSGAGGFATDIIFDESGNLIWSIGATDTPTSWVNVYKITPDGVSTNIASIQANGGILSANLAINSAGEIILEASNYYNGTTYNLTSYVYKLSNIDYSVSVLASHATSQNRGSSSLPMDANGNIYWVNNNYYNGSTYALNSYIHVLSAQNYFV